MGNWRKEIRGQQTGEQGNRTHGAGCRNTGKYWAGEVENKIHHKDNRTQETRTGDRLYQKR